MVLQCFYLLSVTYLLKTACKADVRRLDGSPVFLFVVCNLPSEDSLLG